MEVIIKSTSSRVDDMVLIETSTTIGESVTTSRAGYTVDDLMENRFLAGTLEERTETLRASAERMTETSVRLHFQALVKIATPEPFVEDVSAVPSSQLQGTKADILIVDDVETPVKEVVKKNIEDLAAKMTAKKPRAKLTTKPTESK